MLYPFRKKLRLDDYDYSQSGYYFVTICSPHMSFGCIENAQMQLSRQGQVAQDLWHQIPTHYPAVSIDEFVVMPNHVHGRKGQPPIRDSS